MLQRQHKTEKESLKEKEKAFDVLIKSQQQKAAEESALVEELKLTKEMLTKAHQELENKTKALDAELEKVKVNEVSTKTASAKSKVSNVKNKEILAYNKEKYQETPCKYFNKTKGCRRGSKCWFYHDVDNESKNLKKNKTKKFKVEQNEDREPKQEQGSNINQVIIELLKLLLRENNI